MQALRLVLPLRSYARRCAGTAAVYLALIIEPLGAAPLVEIDYVTVGDPGNPNDSTGYGQVDYVYQIGKYEVTCAQYAAFLNARAKRDTNGLYNPGMASSSRGGIVRAGTEGSYTHTVKAGFANVPVCFVNFYDALRFCNWLHNGAMEFSDTETGAYALSGSNVPGIERTNKALVFLPSDNEWYKAAYYHATSSGGPANGYWLYPTKSNVAPVGEPPSGGVNSANYRWNIFNGGPTNVGSYIQSSSHYGTYDQAGNEWEWTEAVFNMYRGLRGGCWADGLSDQLRATYQSPFQDPNRLPRRTLYATEPVM